MNAFLRTFIADEPSACGPRTEVVCGWVYDHTGGNSALARLADWLLGRPLAIAGLLALGWILQWVVRRLVRRGVNRVLAQPPLVALPPTLPREDGDEALPPTDVARRETRAHAVSAAVSSLLSALIWVVVLVSVLAVLGLDLGPVIAGAGLAGVALAFGAQSLIQDLFAGLFILLEDHFGIGDDIEVGDADGTVEKITLRETVLRDVGGTVWHIRNGDIRRVGNHSQVWSAVLLDVEVARTADVSRALAALLDIAGAVTARPDFAALILEPPEVLGVQSLSPDGVTLRLRVRTQAGRHYGLRRALLQAVDTGLPQAGIERSSRLLTVRSGDASP